MSLNERMTISEIAAKIDANRTTLKERLRVHYFLSYLVLPPHTQPQGLRA